MTRLLAVITVVVLALAVVIPTLAERPIEGSSTADGADPYRTPTLLGFTRDDAGVFIGALIGVAAMAVIGSPSRPS